MSEKKDKTGLGNFEPRNCVTCGYMQESHFMAKRCQGCNLTSFDSEPTRWYPQDTIPVVDEERVL